MSAKTEKLNKHKGTYSDGVNALHRLWNILFWDFKSLGITGNGIKSLLKRKT